MLIDFAGEQERIVRERAAKLRRLWELRPLIDLEALAERQIASWPQLRGVSSRELLAELCSRQD
jgi:hypothetical protein